ncbi:MAG: ATP-binding protein, partial [Anaerolineales bacterium]|nr:ATP-binding protein [Anaerolineales bacterium]
LDREALTSVQRNYSRQIRAAGQHLLDLIGEVLDLAKIEAGRLALEHIEFDLGRTLDQVAAVAVKRAQTKGLAVAAVLSSELPNRVRGDPTRLRQVLINLLDNAVKFTERGEVGLRVEPAPEDGRLLFRVWDTGIGMDERAVQKLFQPFTQADESTTRKYGGTGLGLAICKDLVEAMGGTLQVESHPGQGSRFWFSLPLERVDDAPESSAAAETSAAEEEGAEGRVAAGRSIPSPALQRHVLLVEDNP